DTFDDCLKHALEYTNKFNLSFIDPFNNLNTIAGQGTIAKEILDFSSEENINFDYCFAAVGGGGLISGVGTYLKDKSPSTQLIGVEPLGASSMAQSVKANKVVALTDIDKFVDGASVGKVGELTFDIAKNVVDNFVAIDEGEVCSTILDMYSKLAIIAEPRSEEHTSELQSRFDLVCRLLLEKKNNSYSTILQ